jgi:hypothetical protein
MKRAETHRLEGHWKTVQTFLSKPILSDSKALEFLLNHFSVQDIFGNLVPRMQRLALTVKVVKRIHKKPRMKERKRGYDDKGSLRFPHEYHGEDLGLPALPPVKKKDPYLFGHSPEKYWLLEESSFRPSGEQPHQEGENEIESMKSEVVETTSCFL